MEHHPERWGRSRYDHVLESSTVLKQPISHTQYRCPLITYILTSATLLIGNQLLRELQYWPLNIRMESWWQLTVWPLMAHWLVFAINNVWLNLGRLPSSVVLVILVIFNLPSTCFINISTCSLGKLHFIANIRVGIVSRRLAMMMDMLWVQVNGILPYLLICIREGAKWIHFGIPTWSPVLIRRLARGKVKVVSVHWTAMFCV